MVLPGFCIYSSRLHRLFISNNKKFSSLVYHSFLSSISRIEIMSNYYLRHIMRFSFKVDLGSNTECKQSVSSSTALFLSLSKYSLNAFKSSCSPVTFLRAINDRNSGKSMVPLSSSLILSSNSISVESFSNYLITVLSSLFVMIPSPFLS